MEKKSGDKLTWLTLLNFKMTKIKGVISEVITKEDFRVKGKSTTGQEVSEIVSIFDNSITWL